MRYAIAGLLLILLAGCEKREKNEGQAWDGKQHAYDSCQSFTPYNYSGAVDPIPNNRQHIPTQTDVLAQPLNQLYVSICDAQGTCKSTPSVYILFEPNAVVLLHAFDAGYVTWNISEIVCGL